MIFPRLLLLAAMLAASAGCRAEPQPAVARPVAEGQAQTGLEVVPLRIASANGSHAFRIEVARSPKQREIGMMFRRKVAPDTGMIFPFAPPQPVSFWMKNTLVPLDMVFIRADGTIAWIATAAPLSLEPVGPVEPIAAVLELAGGRAAELGIREGDAVSWPGGPSR